MTTEDFIIELFCRVDDRIGHLPKHSQASLYPSEVVPLALLFAKEWATGLSIAGWREIALTCFPICLNVLVFFDSLSLINSGRLAFWPTIR
jgi:hypothetical protein